MSSRRYDGRTTTFSPEGRLFQVEYAMAAIDNAGACVGVLAKDGIVIASEKKAVSKLLAKSDTRSDKIYTIDAHIVCAVAGLTSDANVLIEFMRVQAQQYRFQYAEPIPVEQLVQRICDEKQYFTQIGGMRPYGVSFLFAGWDKNYGFQLYHSDPSGNYGGWLATCIGNNSQAGRSQLKAELKKLSKIKSNQAKKRLPFRVIVAFSARLFVCIAHHGNQNVRQENKPND